MKKRKAAHAGVVQENVVEIRFRARDTVREAGVRARGSKPEAFRTGAGPRHRHPSATFAPSGAIGPAFPSSYALV